MKKCLCIMLCVCMLFAMCGCSKKQSKDLLAEIKERGYIIVGTEGDWAPYTYHDESGTLTGFDVEMAKLIAKDLGVDVRFEETDFDSILAGVDSGRFDIACNGVGYTDERAQKYNFSTPYVYMGTVLVVGSDNTDIKDFTDLKGKLTANTSSSTYAQISESYGATVQPVNTLTDTIELLLAGRIDATVNAAASIADYLMQHPDAKIKIAANSTDDAELDCIPVVKDERTDSLLKAIESSLDKLRASGELSALSEKFFGADYTKR